MCSGDAILEKLSSLINWRYNIRRTGIVWIFTVITLITGEQFSSSSACLEFFSVLIILGGAAPLSSQRSPVN